MNQDDRYLLFLRATYALRLLSSRQFPASFLCDDVFTGAMSPILPGWALDDLMDAQEELEEDLASLPRRRRRGRALIGQSRPPAKAARKTKQSLIKGLQEALDSLEPPAKQLPRLEQRLQRLGDIFDMDDTERDILRLHGACGIDPALREFLEDGELSGMRRPYHRFVSVVLCSPEEEVRKRLVYGSRLRRLRVFEDNDVVQAEHSLMEVVRPLQKILASETSPDAILETIISREPAPELTTNDYEHLSQDLEIAGRMLETAWQQRRPGVNLLLYGAPGLGKTQFARLLAHRYGAAAYALARKDDDGSPMNAQDRFVAYALFQRVSQGETRPLLIIDEAEGLLCESGGLMALLGGRTERDNSLKGLLTDALEQNHVPVIWLVNHQYAIHDAVKRRFSYSIGFEELGRKVALRIWQRALHDLPRRFALSADTLREFVDRFDLSPGDVGQAMATWRAATSRRKPQLSALEQILGRAHELHHDEKPKARRVRGVDSRYNPHLLHLDGDVDARRLILRVKRFHELRDAGAMDGPDQLTLLFHGLPGTGKTELAKHLAEQCRRKLQVERMSDLLSKWVGESEQNIAGAFRRAADAGNILLLDEFDSLAYDRGKAQHSWEISQTNELLQQIENFPGVLIASTNRLDSLDDAIYRRFSHKLGFLGIRRERRVEATAQYFQELLGPDGLTSAHERRLLALPSLHPGDFRAVWQQLSAQMLEGSAVTADALVTALEHEASFRRDGGPRIGFGRQ